MSAKRTSLRSEAASQPYQLISKSREVIDHTDRQDTTSETPQKVKQRDSVGQGLSFGRKFPDNGCGQKRDAGDNCCAALDDDDRACARLEDGDFKIQPHVSKDGLDSIEQV